MSDTTERLTAIRRNPTLMVRESLNALENALGTEEYQFSDPTNPFIFLIENMAVNGAGILTEQEAVLRSLYPSMAMKYGELYPHMSDADYINRFVTPTDATFTFLLNLEEVKSSAVSVGTTGVRKLVLPEYLRVVVGELTFTLLYPVEIRVMRNGGLQVLFDTSRTTPVQSLTSNSLDWTIVNLEGRKCIRVSVPLVQLSITTMTESLTTSEPLNVSYTLTDSYYYCRMFYQKDGTTEWVEINTTHTDQTFDPRVPTALLQVTEDTINIKIPGVYYERELIDNSKCRIDVYTSKGKVVQDLSTVVLSDYKMNIVDKDGTAPLAYTSDYSKYVAPITTFNDLQVLSNTVVNGGSDAKTFEEMREKVIMNTLGANDIPISHPQLVTHVNNLGFDIVTHINNISDREFLATRQLPLPTSGTLNTSIGCITSELRVKLADLSSIETISDNDDRMTLLPSTLYRFENGTLKVIGNGEAKRLAGMTTDALTREVNTRGYLWTPFYYVMDTSENTFTVRPYDLDRPVIKYRSLANNNDTTAYQANITAVQINKIDDGYMLDLRINGNEAFLNVDVSNVIVQFGYQPTDGDIWCSANAVYVDTDSATGHHFRCYIRTNYDVKKDLRLRTTNMSIYNERQTVYYIPLDTAIDVTIAVSEAEHSGYEANDMDNLLQTHLLPNNGVVSCIVRERIHLTLGYSLDKLWHQASNKVTTEDYQRWEEDVPYVHTEDVYEYDETGTVKLIEKPDGTLDVSVLHRKGDTLVDSNGSPVYRHRKGDIKHNDKGETILKNKREMVRTFAMFLLDGQLRFVTDPEMVNYRTEVAKSIVDWTDKLTTLKERLLDQSNIQLKPTTTMGTVQALVMGSQRTAVPVEQTITVTYFVSDAIYRNNTYRQALKESTIAKISELLANTTVTNAGIVSALKSIGGEDIISVDVSGLGGNLQLSTITLLDDSARLALAKRLIVKSNHTIGLEEACDVSIVRHSVTS